MDGEVASRDVERAELLGAEPRETRTATLVWNRKDSSD